MKNILLLIAVLITIVACAPDDTVHDFTELNEVTISGLNDAYQFNFLEVNTIEPEVTTNLPDDNQLEYRWYMFTKSTKFVADTLSKEKTMKSVISATPGLDYILVFSVKDLTTEVVYKKTMSAEVFSELTKGTVLLVEEDGKKSLNFIRPDKSVLHDVYSDANSGKTIGSNSNKIQYLNPNNFKPELKNIIVFSDDNDGGVLLNAVDFKADRTLRESFFQDPTATTLHTETYAQGSFSDYLIMNGKIFNRAVNVGDLKWKPQLLITDTSIESDYILSNVVINEKTIGYDGAILFDDLNGRFLKHTPPFQGSLVTYSGGSSTVFDYNNTGMKMLFSGKTVAPSGYQGDYYFAICESKADPSKRYLMKFLIGSKDDVSGNEFHADQLTEISQQDNPGLYDAKTFAADDSMKGVLWYSDGDKLFALNTATQGASEIVTRNFLSEGITVDVMKFYTNSYKDADDTQIEKTQLRVAVRDNNLSSGMAGMLYLEGSTLGGINISEKERVFGLGDRIIDFDEKLN